VELLCAVISAVMGGSDSGGHASPARHVSSDMAGASLDASNGVRPCGELRRPLDESAGGPGDVSGSPARETAGNSGRAAGGSGGAAAVKTFSRGCRLATSPAIGTAAAAVSEAAALKGSILSKGRDATNLGGMPESTSRQEGQHQPQQPLNHRQQQPQASNRHLAQQQQGMEKEGQAGLGGSARTAGPDVARVGHGGRREVGGGEDVSEASLQGEVDAGEASIVQVRVRL
jgi:hypothetical protein